MKNAGEANPYGANVRNGWAADIPFSPLHAFVEGLGVALLTAGNVRRKGHPQPLQQVLEGRRNGRNGSEAGKARIKGWGTGALSELRSKATKRTR